MSPITWEEPFCGEGNNCFRIGTDAEGNGYLAVAGEEGNAIRDSREALAALIREIKAGRADHLLA
jgi:hypothetical protein